MHVLQNVSNVLYQLEFKFIPELLFDDPDNLFEIFFTAKDRVQPLYDMFTYLAEKCGCDHTYTSVCIAWR